MYNLAHPQKKSNLFPLSSVKFDKAHKAHPLFLKKQTKKLRRAGIILTAELIWAIFQHFASSVVSSAMVLPPGTVVSPLSTVSGTRWIWYLATSSG